MLQENSNEHISREEKDKSEYSNLKTNSGTLEDFQAKQPSVKVAASTMKKLQESLLEILLALSSTSWLHLKGEYMPGVLGNDMV